MLQLNKAFLTIKTMTKYFLTKIFLWLFCWSCSAIVTMQKNGFCCLKKWLFSSAKDFDNKTRDKIFSGKSFLRKLCSSCSSIVTIHKNEFYCFKILFFSSAKHFRQQKQGQIIFWQIFFHGNFVEIVQQLWPTKKINYTV